MIEGSGIAAAQINQGPGGGFRLTVVATQLHLDFSMPESEMLCQEGPSITTTDKDNKMHSQYRVRRLRLADLDRIMQIERASFGEEAYDRNLFAGFFHKCGDLFLVAVHERRVWGYMITCPRGERAELVSVAVDPAARGRGAASALMESTLQRLRRRGVTRFHLMVRVTNDKARAFYERYGFERERKAPRYYEDGGDGWRMARDL